MPDTSLPTSINFLESCRSRLRFYTGIRTIYPCASCKHFVPIDRHCRKLEVGIPSPDLSTCAAFEIGTRDRQLIIFEQLLSVVSENDKPVLEGLLANIRDQYPNGAAVLARAISLRLGELHGGLGDK